VPIGECIFWAFVASALIAIGIALGIAIGVLYKQDKERMK
jgi:hypothetical protein